MGIQDQEVKKKLHQRRRHGTRAEEDHPGGGKNVWDVLTLPLQQQQQQLKPVKTGRRRRQGREEERGEDDEEVEEAATTPKGEGCRIPAEAETCPPAPKKKPRTAVLVRDSCRCDCDCDGEALDEFFRVPLDLEAVFTSVAAKAN